MTQPAPLWRRFAAAVYDGLLLLGLWMVTLLFDTIVRDLIGVAREWHTLRALLFVVGLVFFGWFWTHGGQTLGMRAWRLRLRRRDGSPLRWFDAGLRFALMLVSWGVVLTPALMRLPTLAAKPQAALVSAVAGGAAVLGLILTLLDGERRAPHDHLSGTAMTYEPRAIAADTAEA